MSDIKELLKDSELTAGSLQTTAVTIEKIHDNMHIVAADNMNIAAEQMLSLIKYIKSNMQNVS